MVLCHTNLCEGSLEWTSFQPVYVTVCLFTQARGWPPVIPPPVWYGQEAAASGDQVVPQHPRSMPQRSQSLPTLYSELQRVQGISMATSGCNLDRAVPNVSSRSASLPILLFLPGVHGSDQTTASARAVPDVPVSLPASRGVPGFYRMDATVAHARRCPDVAYHANGPGTWLAGSVVYLHTCDTLWWWLLYVAVRLPLSGSSVCIKHFFFTG